MSENFRGLENLNSYVVVTIYVVVSMVYILLSDLLLISVGTGLSSTLLVSVLKGFVFVILTAALLLLLIRWNDRKLLASCQCIYDLKEEMKQKDIRSQLARMESIGHLAAGMAHNLNNALTVIAGNMMVIKERCEGSEETDKYLAAMEGAVDRARMLSNTLLTFSEGGDPVKELTDLRNFVPGVIDNAISDSKVGVTYDLSPDLTTVLADPGQLGYVFNALVMNALEVLPEGGRVDISGRNVDLKEQEVVGLKAGEYVRIDLHDSGPGIPKKHLQHIFDPFYSTKGPTRGMGLALVRNIVRRHYGMVTVISGEGMGTTFSIYLPTYLELPEQFVEVKRRADQKHKILWMDDEPGIREVGKDLLEYLGYEADVVADGKEALDSYGSALRGEPYSAVILDLMVPEGMGGAETLQNLMKMDPQVRAVVCSGYSNDPIMANHLEHGFLAVLPKPFKMETLQKVLSDLLGS